MSFVLDGKRYTVCYLNNPKNPSESRWSERDYGRFGCYVAYDVTEERPLIVSYRDFRYVITYVVQLWLFATPVLYALDIIPAKWRLLYAVNPMVGMMAGFRGAVLGGALPLDVIAVGFVAAAILLGLALRYFTTVERRFADVI